MFSVKVNIDGLERKLDTLAESAADLEKPLRIFGGYLRKRALERYKAQGFPPLAKATLEARASKGLAGLESKLKTDLKKAMGRKERAPRGMLEALIGASSGGVLDALAGDSKGVRNRRAVLEEFQRRHRRSSFEEQAGGVDLSLKQLASLDNREGRAIAKAVGQPILGQLPRTLEVEVGAGTVTLRSHTFEHFSDVHNEGGTAGHGAKIPERRTIVLEDRDIDVLDDIIKAHLLEGFQGPEVDH